jgi:hypothetical protein
MTDRMYKLQTDREVWIGKDLGIWRQSLMAFAYRNLGGGGGYVKYLTGYSAS